MLLSVRSRPALLVSVDACWRTAYGGPTFLPQLGPA
jgi:hypothetical protein